MNELPIPYWDYLYIEPIENKQVVGNALKTMGKVIAVGGDVGKTSVGEYVAFELWDKPEFTLKDGKTCHFVREKDLICKVPASWV